MKHTPIETYTFENKQFDVKREDLFKSPPYPKLAKLRGIIEHISKLKDKGIYKIGVFDTRVSSAGWGVAAVCNELNLECHTFFPYLKAQEKLNKQQIKCKELNAILHKMKGGRTGILYSRAKKIAKSEGIYMLPLGLVCTETTLNVMREAKFIPLDKYKSIIISTGTGTILSGVILGVKNIKIYAISAGMNEKKQKNRIKKLWENVNIYSSFDNIEFHISDTDYYTPENCECPFPSHEHYDRKAFKWMIDNFDKIEKPILFWNIGSNE